METDRTNKPHAREVLVSAPAGSVIFTHCGLYHSGSLNLRPSTRYFISCYINRLGLPVRDVQSGALVQAKIEHATQTGDARVIRLLGGESHSVWMGREEAMWGRLLGAERRQRAAMARL